MLQQRLKILRPHVRPSRAKYIFFKRQETGFSFSTSREERGLADTLTLPSETNFRLLASGIVREYIYITLNYQFEAICHSSQENCYLISFFKLLTSTPLMSPVFWTKGPHQRCLGVLSHPLWILFHALPHKAVAPLHCSRGKSCPSFGMRFRCLPCCKRPCYCLCQLPRSLLPLRSCRAVVVSPCPGTGCTFSWNKLIHSHTVSSLPDFKFFDDRASVRLTSKSSIMFSPILYVLWTLHVIIILVLVVKNLPDNAGDVRDLGSVSGSGRSPGEWNGNPL